MFQDARRPLLATSASVDGAALPTTTRAQATQSSIFGAGMCIFLLSFLVYQCFEAVQYHRSQTASEKLPRQALWIANGLFQTGGLVLTTIADLDMNLYVSRRKRAVLAGIVYYGRLIGVLYIPP